MDELADAKKFVEVAEQEAEKCRRELDFKRSELTKKQMQNVTPAKLSEQQKVLDELAFISEKLNRRKARARAKLINAERQAMVIGALEQVQEGEETTSSDNNNSE